MPSPAVALLWISTKNPAARPNPPVKRSTNGKPPGPSHRYGVHFLWLGPGVLPLPPAYLYVRLRTQAIVVCQHLNANFAFGKH
jgi:hypothetical protein